MPELPEVETSKRGIEPYLLGKTIEKIIVRCLRLRWQVSEQLMDMGEGRIERISRRAKYLIFETDRGDIITHLGMSGAFLLIHPEETIELKKHDHVDLITTDGFILRYNDPRRFGAWLYSPSYREHKIFQSLGVEPLDRVFNGQYLYEKSKNRRISIKQLLMDNAVVVGIGNIYACESLFVAKIKPQMIAGNLSLAQARLLVAAIKKVLKAAIKQGGTTLKDFAKPDGTLGYFKQELKVYAKAHQPCPRCTQLIASQVIAGRTTFFCDNCQQ